MAPANIQISGRGEIAYVATFKGRGCLDASCLGLFFQNRLQAVSAGGSAAFILIDGNITVPPGTMWVKAADASVKGFWASVRRRLPTIGSTTTVFRTPLPGTGPVVIQGQPIPLGGQPAPQAAQASRTSPFPQSATPVTCTIPTNAQYAFPTLWPSERFDASGPIGSVVPQPPLWGKVYRPFGANTDIANWSRKVFFSPDCRVIAVAIAPIPSPAITEIITPAGLVTRFNSERGTYHLEGAGEAILPPPSAPIENQIRIDSSCLIMLPVTLREPSGSRSTLLLGAPPANGGCVSF